jgi:hypothetical protein
LSPARPGPQRARFWLGGAGKRWVRKLKEILSSLPKARAQRSEAQNKTSIAERPNNPRHRKDPVNYLPMHALNAGLVAAFPTAVREHVLAALETFPEPEHPAAGGFSVKVAGELVTIPYRLYHSPGQIKAEPLTDLEKEIVDCLLTRHHDGFVRQQYLQRIIRSGNPWVPPFVVQLLGEYSIEIIGVIYEHLGKLNGSVYREFLQANPEFFTQTAQRVESYWNRYHRRHPREEYVGFKVLEFFKSLVG